MLEFLIQIVPDPTRPSWWPSGWDWPPPNVADMLNNLVPSFGALQLLVTAFAYLAGIMFGVKAMFVLKQYGEARTMMSSSANLKVPMMYLLVAAAFIYLPTMMDNFMTTIFNYGVKDIPALPDPGKEASTGYPFIRNITYFVQFVGIVAFIRGWFANHQPARRAF